MHKCSMSEKSQPLNLDWIRKYIQETRMYDQTEKSAKNPTGTFSVEISVILWGSYLSVNASKIYRCVWFWNIISMFNPFLEAKISSILIKSMIRRSKQASRITHWLKTMVLEHCLRRSFDCSNFSRFFREYFHVSFLVVHRF